MSKKAADGGRTHEAGTAQAHSDQHQIDIGTYQIYQGTAVTAELLVEEDPSHPKDARYRIEHWGLYPSYQMPSPTLSGQTLQFRYVRTDYGGSAADFRAHLRTITGVRYIQAACAEQAP